MRMFDRLRHPVFDIERLQESYQEVRAVATPAVSSRGGSCLRSISLTHRPGAEQPLFDGNVSQFKNGARVYEESQFSEFNHMFRDTYFYEVYRALPFQVGRMRLMHLDPVTVYGMHCDGARRAHLAIDTNVDCLILFRSGEALHIPDDGTVWIIDATQPHTAVNASERERVHLAISIVG
jgi:Aspartyl/Asparaginyl beta-hydroxylase